MNFVTIDFETYYDTASFTLTKMSTEDYVNDPRFEVILVGIKINNDAPYWITGTHKEIKAHLAALNLAHCAVLAHNMAFDGLILQVVFGIVPAMYCDSMMLAQAQLKPYSRSISLDSCLKHIDLGIHKGTEVHNMNGRTRASLSPAEMQRYGQYCMDDCEGEFRLFKYLAPQFPKTELEVMDLTLRMYLQPQMTLSSSLLAMHLHETQVKKQTALNSLPAGVTKEALMSNPKFANILMSYGVDVPTKISLTTGLVTYAFAKTDTAWKELEEDWADDPEVSAILATRVSAKSTIEESRTIRLLEISKNYERFRIPIRYYAAHTGRDGGMERINAQNLPRVDKSKLRFAVTCPPGYVILAADLAQIEARITAWLAGQKNLIEGFRNKEDIYSNFASVAFKIDTVKGRSKDDDKRRFVGKTCILGLGFGMGDTRLRAALRQSGVKMEVVEVMNLVNTYRALYPRIPGSWRALDQMLPTMSSGAGRMKWGPLVMAKHSIILPNGMALVYNNLRTHESEKYTGYVYNFANEVRTLWGGKVMENAVQALARILVMEYMLKIRQAIGIIPALRQHDELDYVVEQRYAAKIALVIGKIMRVPPSWAPDLPVDVEINYGPSLGDCK